MGEQKKEKHDWYLLSDVICKQQEEFHFLTCWQLRINKESEGKYTIWKQCKKKKQIKPELMTPRGNKPQASKRAVNIHYTNIYTHLTCAVETETRSNNVFHRA